MDVWGLGGGGLIMGQMSDPSLEWKFLIYNIKVFFL